MRTGLLRHQVTLQQLVAGSPPVNPIGEPDEAWTDIATVAAAIEPLRGRELIAAQAAQSEATGQIRIRYRSGVTTKFRVKFGTRFYDILGVVNNRELNWELLLLVKEDINNG